MTAEVECPNSKRVDGLLHSWSFDGDDPRIWCFYCGEVRDALSGEVYPWRKSIEEFADGDRP